MSQWHSRETKDVIQALGTNPDAGLTDQEVTKRLSQYGLNKLVEEREIRFLAILREEIILLEQLLEYGSAT